MLRSLLILLCLTSSSAFATGIRTITAKVDSFDEKTVTLKIPDGTIKLNKSDIPKDQQKNLKANGTITMPLNERVIQKATAHPKAKPPQAKKKK